MTNFLFADLSTLTRGKPFTGFAAGSFVDMNGRAVEFTSDRLQVFLMNTLRAIEESRSRGMPGLPIDARQHDKGEAAGWIVDASLGEVKDSEDQTVPVILFTAEWTSLGVELLDGKLMANFSPTVDLKHSVIRGGSLTNWPASVDANGVPLFPAVELSKSLDQTIRTVHQGWGRRYGGGVDTWVVEVFDDYLIALVGETTYRVSYEISEGSEISFAPREEWIEVEQAWVSEVDDESALQQSVESDSNEGEIDMAMTQEELDNLVAERVREALKAELAAFVQPAPSTGGATPEFDVVQFLELEGATEDVVGAFKQQMLDQYELMKKRATTEAAEMIARIRRDSDIADFAQAVTSGSQDVPYGLPVSAEDLREFLSRLAPTDLAFAKKLLSDLQVHGRTRFAELGHSKRMKSQVALPTEFAQQLRYHVDHGGEIDAWFSLAGLGDPDEFDLSAFRNGKEK